VKPVYWKPRYATRRMRERAFANAELERERRVRAAAGPTFLSRLLARFR
jgi:hypothetical protein